jgi:pimeloyl-ACP methyl ester carboxylesterase
MDMGLRPVPLAALPPGITQRVVPGVNGMAVHVLEAGTRGRPCALLLHGFPELAYSWRKVMVPLAQAGFHVLAPDQRGYGGTHGWDARYDGDLNAYRMLSLVRDVIALLAAERIASVRLLAGHDFGSPVAAWCALARPDLFESVALMSAPFPGPPVLPLAAAADPIHRELAALPRPRQHYQWYYSNRCANADMLDCPQGLHAFLRAYYHYKSADWPGNAPHPLAAWNAGELARMPTYYLMELSQNMAQTVAPFMPSAAEITGNRWLTDEELGVYARAFEATGLQGALNWYRCATNGMNTADGTLFSGRRIEVPALFIAGKSDWGVYQKPGEFERMQTQACARMLGCHLIDGAGHWVQQEQPERVAGLLLEFERAARA